MTDKPQTPAADRDARARETIALCDHDWSDAERHIAAALRSAHASGLSERDAGWQAIESAPRDGTMILGWCRSLGRQIVYWGAQPEHNPHATWISATCRINHIDKPTHWRPLPAPPDPKDQQA